MPARSSLTVTTATTIATTWGNNVRDCLVPVRAGEDAANAGQLCVDSNTKALKVNNGSVPIELIRYSEHNEWTPRVYQYGPSPVPIVDIDLKIYYCRWVKHGRNVTGKALLEMRSDSPYGVGLDIYVADGSFPIPLPTPAYYNPCCGVFGYVRYGVAWWVGGVVATTPIVGNALAFLFQKDDASSVTYGSFNFGCDPAITPARGDQIYFQFQYEATS